jgi:TRAP transporter TAXI family solute receptor
MPKRPPFFLVPVALSLVLACGGSQAPAARFLSIATGGTGGVYYPYGGGLAKVLNENLAGTRVTAEVTAASVDNLKLIRDGRADIAFALADTLAEAVAGRGPFDGRPVRAASLAVLYSNYTHVVTRASSGLTSLAGLRG